MRCPKRSRRRPSVATSRVCGLSTDQLVRHFPSARTSSLPRPSTRRSRRGVHALAVASDAFPDRVALGAEQVGTMLFAGGFVETQLGLARRQVLRDNRMHRNRKSQCLAEAWRSRDAACCAAGRRVRLRTVRSIRRCVLLRSRIGRCRSGGPHRLQVLPRGLDIRWPARALRAGGVPSRRWPHQQPMFLVHPAGAAGDAQTS